MTRGSFAKLWIFLPVVMAPVKSVFFFVFWAFFSYWIINLLLDIDNLSPIAMNYIVFWLLVSPYTLDTCMGKLKKICCHHIAHKIGSRLWHHQTSIIKAYRGGAPGGTFYGTCLLFTVVFIWYIYIYIYIYFFFFLPYFSLWVLHFTFYCEFV